MVIYTCKRSEVGRASGQAYAFQRAATKGRTRRALRNDRVSKGGEPLQTDEANEETHQTPNSKGHLRENQAGQ